VCSGASTTLTANGSGGAVFEWYDAESGGNLLSTKPQYTTEALTASTKYYVQQTVNGCTSPRATVTVTVSSAIAPTVQDVTVCAESSAMLAASAPEGTLEWYDSPKGGNLLASGTSFQTPALSTATTYYVQTVLNGCISMRVPVTVKTIGFVSPGFKYESDTYCITGKEAIPKIFAEEGGTFSASPVGLVFKDKATGEIDLQASKLGLYTIFFTSNGPCPHISKAGFTITNLPNSNFSYQGPYCQGDSVAHPTFLTGSSAGIITAMPAGLVFSGSGTIDLVNSRPGIYTVTNYIPASGDCVSSKSTTNVIINAAPTIDAGVNQSVAPGSAISLAGKVKGATNFRWYGGLGTFSDPGSLTPKYIPAAGETKVTLFLTATSTGPCAARQDSLTITMDLVAPKATGVSVCYGTAATLTANASIGSVVWYDAPTGGSVLIENATYVTSPLTKTSTYYVQAYSAGNVSARTPVKVIVNAIATPVVPPVTACFMSSANLVATGEGIFQWYDAATGGNLLATGSTFKTPVLSATTTYYVDETLNGCTSPRMPVIVTVNPIPEVTSAALETICNSVGLNYQITGSVPGTTFSWSRKAVDSLINPAVENQTSSIINEVLTTRATKPVNVTYVITPIYKGCAGPAFEYVVTIDLSPIVTSPNKGAICNNSASNYAVQYNLPGTAFNWSRSAVAGISNPTINGQASPVIREVLSNTTNAPIDVTYVFNQSYNGCAAPPFVYVVTVNPIPYVISKGTDYLCNGNSFTYPIKSNVEGASFTWSRPEQANIKNSAVINASSSIISETLTNTGTTPVDVVYTIIPTANGCTGPAFNYRVTVMPTPVAPVINTSSAVCVGKPIALSTTQIAGATYLWTGPNGFTSTQLNPTIAKATLANSGDYTLIVTINGCVGVPGTRNIKVNELPIANAGSDQTACADKPVLLNGQISGGATTGIWSTSGTGTFSPSNTALNASYIASASDIEKGFVQLTLTSTSEDNCSLAASSITVTLAKPPVAEAGPDQNVCSQDKLVMLSGKISLASSGFWTTSGSGTFSPSISDLNAAYIPSSSDIAKGNVTITLNALGANVCTQVTDALTIKFTAPPIVDIGPDVLVPFGKTITLNPSISENKVKYLWTPNVNLDNNTIRNPTFTGIADQVYTLTVTDIRGCVTEDKVFVDVLSPLQIPNTFTPNGDGVNDVWNIPELTTYPGATINIFNRYGAKVLTTGASNTVWDGHVNGTPAPVGTYYYVLDTQFKGLFYSGSITILR
jgi:gliding motility-associated-like protein